LLDLDKLSGVILFSLSFMQLVIMPVNVLVRRGRNLLAFQLCYLIAQLHNLLPVVLVNLFLLLLVIVHVYLRLGLLVVPRATSTTCIPPAGTNNLRLRHADLLNRFFLISRSLLRLSRSISLLSLLVTLVIPTCLSPL
jgi:hypothetical protein